LTGLPALFDELNQTFFHERLRRHPVRRASPGFVGAHGRLRPRGAPDPRPDVRREEKAGIGPVTALWMAMVLLLLAWPVEVRAEAGTPILVYHRFGPVVADSMTVRTSVFERQLELLERQDYTVISLRALVDYLRGAGSPPPARSVIIAVDDGHRSVYTDMLPVLLRHRVPITLFAYPSAVSRARYALTWEQLRDLAATGLVHIHSHTYWHPNFAQEKRRLSPAAYGRLVDDQLKRSRDTLESRLGAKVDMLAWPFGIYDDELMDRATRAGYIAAVTLDRRHATIADAIMALPRYRVTDGDTGVRLQALLEGRAAANGRLRR
jgi:peptidoglycan/xylan/chitin deacetylase (PgdA/CDA1 family)